MKLTDGTIVNTPLRFLGPIREVKDRAGEVTGAYFIFNTHKLYYNSIEEATTIRQEIEEKVPEAETLSEMTKSKNWPVPSEAELAEDEKI